LSRSSTSPKISWGIAALPTPPLGTDSVPPPQTMCKMNLTGPGTDKVEVERNNRCNPALALNRLTTIRDCDGWT
ncbi:MAG: hypothetical protein Q8R70_06265, partial [Methanoregula sp.]|nr:hypothetical protein [Methanoregula sp.]